MMEALVDTGAFTLGGDKRWGRVEGHGKVFIRGVGKFDVDAGEILELRPVFLGLAEVASRLVREPGELEVMIARHPRYWRQRPTRIRTAKLEWWLAELECERFMAIPLGCRARMTSDEIAALVGGDS
jgi:hypothetical protein